MDEGIITPSLVMMTSPEREHIILSTPWGLRLVHMALATIVVMTKTTEILTAAATALTASSNDSRQQRWHQ